MTESASEQEVRIHQLYAVTIEGSLYRVSDEIDPDRKFPIVEKIDLVGISALKVGSRLRGGSNVGVTPEYGLISYNPDGSDHSAYYCTSYYWHAHTSEIVGLFASEAEAHQCLTAYPDFDSWDKRWEDMTNEVIRLIGVDHPVFVTEKELMDRVGLNYSQHPRWR